MIKLGLKPDTFYYFWRNIFVIMFTRLSSLEVIVNLMAMYLHLNKQSKFIIELMTENLHEHQDSLNLARAE